MTEHWPSVVVLLGPVMILMWLTSGLLVLVFLNVGIGLALLAGAVVASTDPIDSIITGRVAEKNIPARAGRLLADGRFRSVSSHPCSGLVKVLVTRHVAQRGPAPVTAGRNYAQRPVGLQHHRFDLRHILDAMLKHTFDQLGLVQPGPPKRLTTDAPVNYQQ